MQRSGSHNKRNTSRSNAGLTHSTSPNSRARSSAELSRGNVGTAVAQDDHPTKDRRRRVLAYYMHAIVTFHTFGIPLSAGTKLEYYYNSLFLTTPLRYLALIFGIQWVGIFAMESIAVTTYKIKHWRWIYFAATVVLLVCHGVMARKNTTWTLQLGMRVIVGLCFGFLRSMTLRCLSSHYNYDIVSVSMQSGAAGMLGASFYSLVAWSFLRDNDHSKCAWAHFWILVSTLSPTLAGMYFVPGTRAPNQYRPKPRLRHRKSEQVVPPQLEEKSHRTKSILSDLFLIVGYFFVFTFVFVWPTFFPVLFTSHPIHEFPDYASYWLFGLFGTGTFTAAWFSTAWPRRGLGVVNTFMTASICGGSLLLIAAFVQDFWAWGVIGVVYGLCLGPLVALHRKVFDLLCKYWTRIGLFPMGLGVFVMFGISLSGVIIQRSGGDVALTVSGVFMISGGVLMVAGRWLKYPTSYVVI